MYIIEVIPLFAIQRHQHKVLSFYHSENLPPGSLVEVLVQSKKSKAVVINCQSIKHLKIRLKKEATFELKPINKVLDKKDSQEPFDITALFPPPKISKTKGSTLDLQKGRTLEKNILDGYLEKLAERKAASKAKNYMQETAEEYLKYIDWENDSFEEDLRLFWISASNYYKNHTHHDFVQILEWIKKKDCLNPKQVAKLFNKE